MVFIHVSGVRSDVVVPQPLAYDAALSAELSGVLFDSVASLVLGSSRLVLGTMTARSNTSLGQWSGGLERELF